MISMSKEHKSYLYILSAAILWGTTGTVLYFAPLDTSPFSVGIMRITAGTFFFIIINFLNKNSSNFTVLSSRKNILLAGLSLAFYQPFFFFAVKKSGVAVGTAVSITSAPVFAGLIKLIFVKKTPEKKWFAATLLSIIGCLLLFSNSEININLSGILLALGAGLSYSLFSLFNKKQSGNNSPLTSISYIFLTASLLYLPLFFIFDFSWAYSSSGLPIVLFLGLITASLPFFLYTKGLEYSSAETSVTLTIAEPLTATLLGVFLLKEKLNLLTGLGLFLLLLGFMIIFINKDSLKRYFHI
ncbi:DME family drug/metabolite transporter [Halanaerobium sp. MA284_MarDTE_T2]|nr:DME family drug/metabolite transporter [Halanaerobium sp. MA284_MarDTE_T2]RCW86538.1 DME family drug/metabolite transporter [Halanaerobium sp. DL-01]